MSNARILKHCLISFITFQGIIGTIKRKEYNFLDQRKMEFDQDYEEFCKQTNDLHVGCIIKIPVEGAYLFFSVLYNAVNHYAFRRETHFHHGGDW